MGRVLAVGRGRRSSSGRLIGVLRRGREGHHVEWRTDGYMHGNDHARCNPFGNGHLNRISRRTGDHHVTTRHNQVRWHLNRDCHVARGSSIHSLLRWHWRHWIMIHWMMMVMRWWRIHGSVVVLGSIHGWRRRRSRDCSSQIHPRGAYRRFLRSFGRAERIGGGGFGFFRFVRQRQLNIRFSSFQGGSNMATVGGRSRSGGSNTAFPRSGWR